MPIQHISDDVLKRMNRRYTTSEYEDLIDTLEEEIIADADAMSHFDNTTLLYTINYIPDTPASDVAPIETVFWRMQSIDNKNQFFLAYRDEMSNRVDLDNNGTIDTGTGYGYEVYSIGDTFGTFRITPMAFVGDVNIITAQQYFEQDFTITNVNTYTKEITNDATPLMILIAASNVVPSTLLAPFLRKSIP